MEGMDKHPIQGLPGSRDRRTAPVNPPSLQAAPAPHLEFMPPLERRNYSAPTGRRCWHIATPYPRLRCLVIRLAGHLRKLLELRKSLGAGVLAGQLPSRVVVACFASLQRLPRSPPAAEQWPHAQIAIIASILGYVQEWERSRGAMLRDLSSAVSIVGVLRGERAQERPARGARPSMRMIVRRGWASVQERTAPPPSLSLQHSPPQDAAAETKFCESRT